ncbi:hypothetical protein [Mameliella sediminis]|nr:hypothetical protein [Mameliella sediminis]MBY6116475.1 hypothetical protein [Antarctobacter heliothermus]MBY6145499.1 hypothetical protein [Mameliella alba]MBV7393777.1 hypothetical protein [Mameliella sediminis]MBY6160823.1 hypothetical protein [Mameliella alba]MBY6169293.1 hypothetical protein [Mameliella alba]
MLNASDTAADHRTPGEGDRRPAPIGFSTLFQIERLFDRLEGKTGGRTWD